MSRAERVWDTHVEDYGNRWRYSVEYFTRGSTYERPASVECFVGCWVGLKERHGQVKDIVIGGFERGYDPDNMKKEFINNNEVFVLTEFSSGHFLSCRKR